MKSLLAYNLLKLGYLLLLLRKAVFGVGFESLGAGLNEVVHPLFDVGLLEIIGSTKVYQSDFALNNVEDHFGLPLTSPTLIF